MNLVFNELSIADNENNIYKGVSFFEKFLQTYSAAIGNGVGFDREIYTAVDFNNLKIANDYYTYMWRNDQKTDRDLVRRFKGMCDRQQISNFFDDESEMYCYDKKGEGILGAFLNGMTLISLASNSSWTEYRLKCHYYTVGDDNEQQVEIDNISSEQQILKHIQEFQEKKKNEVSICNTPEDLLKNLYALFPSLVFHEIAINQVKNQLEKQHVGTVCRKLYELEQYFKTWDGNQFDLESFPIRSISPQSKETLARFKNEHTFIFEKNKKVIVSYHMRYTGNVPGRIYFYPDPETQKALVCSLTTKLPTVSEPKLRI